MSKAILELRQHGSAVIPDRNPGRDRLNEDEWEDVLTQIAEGFQAKRGKWANLKERKELDDKWRKGMALLTEYYDYHWALVTL